MLLEYPTVYRDAQGTEQSAFITDGKRMKIKLRGVDFEGHFWELTPKEGQEEIAHKLFNLNEFGELNGITDYTPGAKDLSYSLSVQIPIKLISLENEELNASIDFGINPPKMMFRFNGKSYPMENSNFEYALSPTIATFLKIKHVVCCVNCKFSEYSPFGNQEYGDMMCFKKCKTAWAQIGYVGLKDPENWEKVKDRQTTQEVFWCEEFILKDEFTKNT